jgi:ATP-dependent DNA helicase RecQ
MSSVAPTNSSAVSQRLLDVLQHYWGYSSFLPLQREAMECVLGHRDSVVVLPTGGGKSLCFQAPALCLDGMALVVSPLISLMKDQVDALRECGVNAAYINSTLTAEERRAVAQQIRNGELKLLYAAPERLLAGQTLDFLQSANVSLIAIDEAHCISAWGHDFRPEYRGLAALKQAFPDAAVHAYTATATERVRDDIAAQLRLTDPKLLVGSFDRPNLVYRVRRASSRFAQICEILKTHPNEAGIVYCISRKEVDKTAAGLCELGFRAAPYHAGLSDADRHRYQDDFIAERVDVIVATVAFGMGIDKSNVRFVIHAGLPKSLENFQQESGRAGRDGLEAECWLLHAGNDAIVWRRMIEDSESGTSEGGLESLAAMEAFSNSVDCRHRALVRHFGQELEAENCGACDVCLGELQLVDDSLTLAQKILSCVARLEQRYGADYTAKVLCGSAEARIVEQGHDQLSTYGLLRDAPAATVKSWIAQLVEQGFLTKTAEYHQLQLTQTGREILRGNGQPQLLRPAEKLRPTHAAADSWEGVDRGLFDELRHLRSELATEREVPAYVVFSDASLRDMARRRPTKPEAFKQVKGVGDRKAADLGPQFLAAIDIYCREHGIETNVTPPRPSLDSAEVAEVAAVKGSSLAAFAYFRRGESVDEVMQQLGRARSTVYGYLCDYLAHEKVMSPEPWVEPAVAERVEHAVAAVGDRQLRPIFDQLGGEVPYEVIRITLTCRRNRKRAQSASA